jgi:ribosome-associated protein
MTDKLKRVIKALSDLKLKDIITYDFQDFSPFFDYQVIATASSIRQVNASINHIKQAFPEITNMHVEGADENHWVLIDLSDIIIHVMYKDDREYYQIEKLFYERKRIEIEDLNNGL